MLNHLERAIDRVLPPSGHPASRSGPVVELVAKLVATRGQARGIHVRLVQVDVTICVNDGNVVAQPPSIELRMGQNPSNSVLLMSDGLWRREPTRVILANSDLQELILLNILKLVRRCDDLSCTSSVVVAAVVRDNRTASDEVVVSVENETGPGKLSRARLSVLEIARRCGEVSRSALFP